MERIEKIYATIYIDWKGETLSREDFITESMISHYYNNPGFLQWNFYLIIPSDYVSDIKKKKEIEENDRYTRKFVLDRDHINPFLKNYFPDLKKKRIQVKLIKGRTYSDSIQKSIAYYNKNIGYEHTQGIYRNKSLIESISAMDELRALLIKNPKIKVVFSSHITNEFSIAEKKFKMLTKWKDTKSTS